MMTGATANVTASIMAALATAALAVIAIFQWHEMKKNNESARKQSELVRDRWHREDELRAEENEPKAEFKLSDNADGHKSDLWCANLGTVAFLVTGLQVDPVFGERVRVFSLEEQGQFVVPVGEERTFILENKKIFGSGYWKNGRVSLLLRGPAGEAKTNSREYCLVSLRTADASSRCVPVFSAWRLSIARNVKLRLRTLLYPIFQQANVVRR